MTAFKSGLIIILVGAILVVGYLFAAGTAASPEPTATVTVTPTPTVTPTFTPTPWHQPRDVYWCPPPEDADPLWLSICERMGDLKACWCPPIEGMDESLWPCYCGQETPTPTPMPATLPQTGGSP